ncbi:hypothetical protein QFC20_000171 [Naganishia adeliensis]|uniref:Uncharacterized protein n=1 Tax=Naganishia adeliensis TaxID=92952 RepID=A0ACC2X2S9_9TREE|nr:hypothetical protein QFC20_000171 [Naganishia adeliensis]
METQEPRHRDPIIFDTLVLLAIQGGFYVLSRRFLLHALPTLRNISKQGSLPEGTAEQNDEYAMKSLRVRGDGNDEDDDFDEQENDRLLNASGGYSDIEAGSQRNGSSRSHQRWRKDVDSDSEDEMSDASRSYAGSPLPSPAPDLISETDNRRMSGISTRSLIRQEAGAASSIRSPTIRTPGVSNNPSAPMSPSRRQSSQVIRLFKSKESTSTGGRAGGNQKEKEKAGATRGLGFLARELNFAAACDVPFDRNLALECMQLTYIARDLDEILRSGNFSQIVNGTRRISSQRLKAAFPQIVHLGDVAELEELDRSMNNTETEDQPDLDGDEDAYEDYEYAFEYYSQQQMWRKGGWLEPSLGRVVVCGVVVLGGLSGLGAVRTAWNFVESGGIGSGYVDNVTGTSQADARRTADHRLV